MVEATCLAWVEVDLDADAVNCVRVQGAPENVVIPADPVVLATDPDEEMNVTTAMCEEAVSLVRRRALPGAFELSG
jgi:hypothetical protein